MADHSTDMSSTGLSAAECRAKVIGIYGISGSGKTALLEELRSTLDCDSFSFYDGSKVLQSVMPEYLSFGSLSEESKTIWREHAIRHIARQCQVNNKTAIVAGHYLFQEAGHRIKAWTSADAATYTHVIYLDPPAESIVNWRQLDTTRKREHLTVQVLQDWKVSERAQLQDSCRENGILFFATNPMTNSSDRLGEILKDWHAHTPELNSSRASAAIDQIFAARSAEPETVLFVDADRTLAPVDSGKLFWEHYAAMMNDPKLKHVLKQLFGGPMGYSYQAFRQVMLLHEEMVANNVTSFNALCAYTASHITLHPEFTQLFRRPEIEQNVTIVVVTCGLKTIWETVLRNHSLGHLVQVIGGGRLQDGCVVTPETKAELVTATRAKFEGRTKIWTMGDSPMDIPMMLAADRAIVIVGEEGPDSRSTTMDSALTQALDNGTLTHASQILLPPTATPRLNPTRLPITSLSSPNLLSSLTGSHPPPTFLQHSTLHPGSQILATPTRDSRISGLPLRRAHHSIGRFLALHHVAELQGTEPFEIPHVQGHVTEGHRLRHEANTTILALMRGGAPMAEGVAEVFPLARLVHVKHPQELRMGEGHVEGKSCIVLVDSVVNSGRTVVEFVNRIDELAQVGVVRVIVVAGVVQEGALRRGGAIGELGARRGEIRVVALRVSGNKFTGSGGTDTGNRLFNTVDLD